MLIKWRMCVLSQRRWYASGWTSFYFRFTVTSAPTPSVCVSPPCVPQLPALSPDKLAYVYACHIIALLRQNDVYVLRFPFLVGVVVSWTSVVSRGATVRWVPCSLIELRRIF